MKKIFLIINFLILSSWTVAQNETIFDYGDSTFQVNSIHYLEIEWSYHKHGLISDSIDRKTFVDLSDFIRSHPNMEFLVESHTDQRGNEKYNLKLTDRRAQNIVEKLLKFDNMSNAKIKSIGYGESRPILKDKYVNQMKYGAERYSEAQEHAFAINNRCIIRITKIE